MKKGRGDTHTDRGRERERLMISMSCWIARLCYRRIMPQVQFIYCIEGSKMTRSFCINKWVVVLPCTKLGEWQGLDELKGKQVETKFSEAERQNNNERQQTNTRNDINKCKENNYKRVETVCLPSSPSCAWKKELASALFTTNMIASLHVLHTSKYSCFCYDWFILLLISSNFRNT